MNCGIDIIQIERIEQFVKGHEQSMSRFYTVQEQAYCQSRGAGKYESYAGIFAAKEAFWKALGTGFRKGKWTDVEVVHNELGAPSFRLHGLYAMALKERGSAPALSIAHDGAYAIAQVIW